MDEDKVLEEVRLLSLKVDAIYANLEQSIKELWQRLDKELEAIKEMLSTKEVV